MSYFAGPQEIAQAGHLVEGSECSFATASSSSTTTVHPRRPEATATRAAKSDLPRSRRGSTTNSADSSVEDDAAEIV